MNLKPFVFILCAGALAACSSTGDYRSSKTISQGLDYSMYTDYEGRYELPSGPLGTPSVLDGSYTQETLPGDGTDVVSTDEDFTASVPASAYDTYGDVVVPVAKKKFQLGAKATSKEMGIFQRALNRAYAVALRAYNAAGFTYSVSSVGAVNPLSDIEVSCMLAESAANSVGQKTCNKFFDELASTYREFISEAE